jgi:hypothetical protein
MNMVQKTFGIYRETSALCQLTIEVGKQHLACTQKIIETGKIFSFELFQFDKIQPDEFPAIFNFIKQQSRLLHLYFPDVQIVWEHPECISVPQELYDEKTGNTYLDLAIGINYQTLNERNVANDVVLVYRVAKLAKDTLLAYFPAAISTHKYYSLLEGRMNKQNTSPDNHMQVLIYEHHFILMVVKDNKWQLTNSFFYKAPEDVLYHILNVCERLDLKKDLVHFYLSGLIDTQSNLYKELELYLLNLNFCVPPPGLLEADGFQEYPAHYFCSFFNIFS